MKTRKNLVRLLSLALCLVLCLSVLPVSRVFAAGNIASGKGWYLDSQGHLYLTGAITNPSADEILVPWADYFEDICLITAMPGAAVDNCKYLFVGCTNLARADLKNLDTTKVKDMSWMFFGCENAIELDVSSFDTSWVTNMDLMFFGCKKLTNLDVSRWDTSSVTAMHGTFDTCSSLVSLNLSSFDLSHVEDMVYFMERCNSLQEVTITHDSLQRLAEPLLALQPEWVNKATGEVYTKDSELKAIEGTVTLVTKSHYLFSTCNGNADQCPLAPFTDAPKYGNWAHPGIEFVVRRGLMGGTSATTFEPKTPMSRSMLVTVLYRMEGEPGAGSSTFNDVKPSKWFSDAVSWAADNGIVTGVGGGNFNPNANVSREQLATILYRYAGYKGYDVSNLANLSSFADSAKVGKWFVDGMQWAVAENIITGSTSGDKTYLNPQGDATREQVAAILMRFLQNVEG